MASRAASKADMTEDKAQTPTKEKIDAVPPTPTKKKQKMSGAALRRKAKQSASAGKSSSMDMPEVKNKDEQAPQPGSSSAGVNSSALDAESDDSDLDFGDWGFSVLQEDGQMEMIGGTVTEPPLALRRMLAGLLDQQQSPQEDTQHEDTQQ